VKTFLKYIHRFFDAKTRVLQQSESIEKRAEVMMQWMLHSSLPVPNWEKIAEQMHHDWEHQQRHHFWTEAACCWLEKMGPLLGEQYRVDESENFLLLSPMPKRSTQLFMKFCETSLRRIKNNLGTLVSDDHEGKYLSIVFSDQDQYYQYISHYYPEDGEYGMSSGMFIQQGYGHFVMCEGHLSEMEPIIVHELTHCLLAYLPIPAWLNEGIAVNTEYVMFPYLADPKSSMYSLKEMVEKHAAFWNEDTIQEFWSGKSFLRIDDGGMLSYDLAKMITSLAAADEVAFRTFVAKADAKDAGIAAEVCLGFPLHYLIEKLFGEGPWRPKPLTWQDGVEHGQFRMSN
jgi:hypothetical protein